jgi:CDP-glucose 4,6-dehydratase
MFNKLKNTYSNKKIFLTGHTGFKGSWLLKILSMMGAEVCGYALEPENKEDIYNLIGGDSICKSTLADLRDRVSLKKSILDFQPDFIFHLAAQPLVRLSYEVPSETFEINAIGTANLLDAVKLLDKPCNVVLITTDKVYFNNEWIYPYRETDRLGGYDPYSASKACAELIIDSYRNSFFNKKNYSLHKKAIAVARAGNVIGGGDWAKDRLIPDIVKGLVKNETILIRNPLSVRPWQHVLEPVLGYLMLGEKLSKDPVSFSDAFNFGPLSEDALPVKEMVELAIAEWGSGKYEEFKNIDQPHEAGLLKLDISKTRNCIGWKPVMNAPAAVSKTIQWYKNFNDSPEAIVRFTELQINDFFNA